jgi:large subunit ribosomal protein L10
LTDYRGLTHQQLEQLKRALKKVEAEFLVVKNTLLGIALEVKDPKVQSFKDAKDKLKEELKNPTAVLFAFGDELAAVKELAKSIKNIQLPKIKIGLFSGKLTTASDFTRLASLPDRQVLLAILAMRLKSPLYGLHYALSWNLQRLVIALNSVKNKK